MRKHRNPRPRLAKQPTTEKPRTRRKRGTPPKLDPRAADALRALLGALGDVDPRKAMRFIEALSAFVTFAAKRRKP